MFCVCVFVPHGGVCLQNHCFLLLWCLLLFVRMCLFVFLVFHEFESPGIELATVKVVILLLNFANKHVFYYFIYFYLVKTFFAH